MNINSVNYATNVSQTNININHGSSGQTQVIVPTNMSPQMAGTALLEQLSIGDRFTGEITNITQNQITISLSDSISVTATLADALSFNIGDIATFSVKDSNRDQVILKSEANEMARSLLNDQSIQSALNNAGLPINETNAALVHNMMRQGLPINADNLNEYARLLGQISNATPEDVVLLSKMGIEVTPENVNALHDYYDYNEGMSGKTMELTESFANMLQGLPESVLPATVSMLSNFVNSFSDTISDMEMLKPSSVEDITKLLSESAISGGEDTPANKDLAEFNDKLLQGKMTAKEFLNELTRLHSEGKLADELLKKIIDSPNFKKAIEEFVRQEMFINPEDVSKENVKKLFAKIIQDTQNLAEKFQGIKLADNMMNVNQDIKNNVDFLNQANQFMNFVQLPIKMAGKNANGDLYVYKNNKRRLQDKEELKALLHLDMDNLGPMDILVKMKNKNVNTEFKVQSEKILAYIEEHIDELNVRLKALGYNVSSVVISEKSDYSFKKDVINEELPATEIKRFSFDIRA